MKVVALLSGGKDSCFTMLECARFGHEIIAVANLYPNEGEEVDSFMFQSVGFGQIGLIAECMEVPLFRQAIRGKARQQQLQYDSPTDGDEVEDLFELLQTVQQHHPDVQAVCCGAVFSTYQRNRVENVCGRLKLTPLAFLWNRQQDLLLDDMIANQIDAIVVKVASLGLDPHKHLGKSISTLRPMFHSLHEKYQFHICGEGGEYETFTLDCPLFKKRIVLDESEVVIHSDDMFAPVGYLKMVKCHLEDKEVISPIATVDSSFQRPDGFDFSDDLDIEVTSSDIVTMPLPYFQKFRQQYYFDGISSSLCTSLEDQVHNVFQRMKLGLNKEEMTLEDVVYVHLYVSDMDNFGKINAIYVQQFGSNPPSRSCVEVSMNANTYLMMDIFALKGSGIAKQSDIKTREVLHVQSISKWAPTCIGPYSQANILNSSMIFLSGQVGFIPETMQLMQANLRSEAFQSIKHAIRVLEVLQSSGRHICSGTLYLKDKLTQDSFYKFESFVRNILVENGGIDDCYENESDSDEEDEAIDQSMQYLQLIRNSPLLFVVVKQLPKNASFEAEFVALTHNVLKALAPNSESYVTESNGFVFQRDLSFIPRTMCISSTRIGFTSEVTKKHGVISFDMLALCKELLESLNESLIKIFLQWHQVLHLRIYYKHSVLSVDDLKIAMYSCLTKFCETPPSMTFIPVEAILPNSFLAVQSTAHDLDKMSTELWLRKKI